MSDVLQILIIRNSRGRIKRNVCKALFSFFCECLDGTGLHVTILACAVCLLTCPTKIVRKITLHYPFTAC